MISLYRISSTRYPTNNGAGAARYGGRWNPVGIAVIYAAQTASLAALEVLVHYSVLPKDQVLTAILVPEELSIPAWQEENLPEGWKSEAPLTATQRMGEQWVRESLSVVLSVPSSIIPGERSSLRYRIYFIINTIIHFKSSLGNDSLKLHSLRQNSVHFKGSNGRDAGFIVDLSGVGPPPSSSLTME